MKKINIIVFFCLMCFSASAVEISRVEPAFWWVGMQHRELQIMIYGKNVAASQVSLSYPNVSLRETVHPENPNYLFLYLEIAPEARPGQMNIVFTEGKKQTVVPYRLMERSKSLGAQGFGPEDVLYLIMPDRFANGDPSNDVWDGEAIDRNDQFFRHGGDLAGVNAHLDYLHDLGVTAIWLNPVLENKMNSPEKYKSYHGYATTDFYRVDPRLGSNDDYCRFIDAAHHKGMKVIMDMIYNHCGSKHWWMGDFPSDDWLNHQAEGFVPTTHNALTVADVHAPPSELYAMVDGWFVPSMPDLNQRNRLLADYLIQNSIWWIEYARIDGIRHDTHPYADFDFLARWCQRVEDEYPDFNIVGEAWHTLSWWQRDSHDNPRNTNLKTVMDFNLFRALDQAFPADPKAPFDLYKLYETLAHDYLYPDIDNILIFLDNHDVSRFVKKEESDLRRYKQALTFLLTTRGIPQLYYGTELLMTGEKNEGDGALRKDFPGGWRDDAVNGFTAAGRTALQNEAFDYLQKLLRWRKTNKAVTSGHLIHYAPDNHGCYVYARLNEAQRVLVVLNGSNEEQTLPTAKYRDVIGSATSARDVLSGKTIDLTREITVAAKGEIVLEM